MTPVTILREDDNFTIIEIDGEQEEVSYNAVFNSPEDADYALTQLG